MQNFTKCIEVFHFENDIHEIPGIELLQKCTHNTNAEKEIFFEFNEIDKHLKKLKNI